MKHCYHLSGRFAKTSLLLLLLCTIRYYSKAQTTLASGTTTGVALIPFTVPGCFGNGTTTATLCGGGTTATFQFTDTQCCPCPTSGQIVIPGTVAYGGTGSSASFTNYHMLSYSPSNENQRLTFSAPITRFQFSASGPAGSAPEVFQLKTYLSNILVATHTFTVPGQGINLKYNITGASFDRIDFIEINAISADDELFGDFMADNPSSSTFVSSSAGPDQNLCTTSATLAANSPGSGTGNWSVVSGPSLLSSQFSNTASATADFTPAGGAGTYVLRWTITNAFCAPTTDEVNIVFATPPTTAAAGVDQNLCTSTASATLAANTPSVGTGSWSVVSGPSLLSSQFSNTASGSATFTPAGGAGTYVLRWTVSNAPCTASTDEVNIVFTAAPTTAAAGIDQNLCTSTASATLEGNVPSVGTGSWSVVSGPSLLSSQFSNAASGSATFTPVGGAGTYVLRWTVSNAPCTASTDEVNIVFTAAPTTAAAGVDQNLCTSTASATLAGNLPSVGTGSWSVVSGPSLLSSQFSNTASASATFTPVGGAGTYVLRWTVSNAPCTASTDEVNIVFTAAPTTSAAGVDQNLCTSTASATLAGNLPSVGTGSWSVVSGPSLLSFQFSNTASATSTFTPVGGAGTYVLRWTIANAPCTASTDEVNIVFTAAPTTAAAGVDQNLCTSTASATLAGNLPSVGTGSWSVVSGPSLLSSQFSNTASASATFTPAGGAGTYVLRWTVSNAPCTASTDEVNIVFTAAPTTSAAGVDQNLCTSTASATLAGNLPSVGMGSWSGGSGPALLSFQSSNTASAASTFTPVGGAGTYVLRWTIANAPCTASTDEVNIVFTAAPTTAAAGVDQNLCTSTASATLAANTPSVGTGSWSVVSGPSLLSSQFSNTASATSTFTPVGGAGTYVLRWTIANAPCTASTDEVNIVFTAAPTTSAAGVDQNLCTSTASATLAGNLPSVGTGSWSVVSGPSLLSSQFSNTASASATFTPAGGAGTYVLRWTVSNAPCTASTDEVNIVFTAAPTTAAAGIDQNLCTSTASATLEGNVPSVGTGSWSVISGPSLLSSQFSNTASATSTFTPAGGAGTYVLRWTIANAPCTASSDEVNIVFTAPPQTAYAGPDKTTCGVTAITLAATGTGTWSGGAGMFSNATLANATYTPTVNEIGTTVVLTWTVAATYPCINSTDQMEVIVKPAPTATVMRSVATVCQNAPAPKVIFAGSGGTAPYTFIYKINGGTPQSISTLSGDTVSATVSTTTAGVFIYTLISVQNAEECSQNQNSSDTITVLAPPIPTNPVGDTISNGESVTLTADGCNGQGFELLWYKSSDNSLVTMPVSPTATTSYYARCQQTFKGVSCLSGRTADAIVVVGLRIFVNIANANPTQDGTSWATAFSSLQSGLTMARNSGYSPIEVWVAQGTYKPGLLRKDVFEIPSDVKVYGGFTGVEQELTARDWNTNKTILSGEIGTAQLNDNTYHVVVFNAVKDQTQLDGFQIEKGYGEFFTGNQNSDLNQPQIRHSGGGILAINKSTAFITHCIITGNKADFGGGMLLSDSSDIRVTETILWGNEATFGGGIYVLGNSKPHFENVLMANNKGLGGAMYVNYSQPTLLNCTLASNKDGDNNAGAIFNTNAITTIKNSILWGNTTPQSTINSVISYSIVEGGYVGTGNINQNPLFVNPNPVGLAPMGSLGDYHLLPCSPAINTGNNTGAPAVDLEGYPRPYPGGNGIVDMGVYERQSIGSNGPENLTVTEPIIGGSVVKNAVKISANNLIAGATVVYQAAQSVTLTPGFSATGNTFQALIAGCEPVGSTAIGNPSQK